MFFLFAALMLLVALGFVCWPLLRRSATTNSPSTEASNLEAFRVQRREVENDFARGLISAAEREAVIEELSSRLAGEIDADAKLQQGRAVSGETASKRPWILAVVLSTSVVGMSGFGYVMLGAHDARHVAAMAAQSPAASLGPNTDANAPLSEKQVLALVENLAKKMEANPEDPKGWILLARSRNALGQWGAAAKAFERAVALTPDDAQLLADYADVQTMVQEGNFAGKPMELTQRALKVDPKNMKALALAGTAEMRAGNKAQSLKYWERLLAVVPKDSDDAAQVASIIKEIKTGQPASAPPASPSAQAVAPTAPAAAAKQSAQPAGKVVSGEVSVATALANKIAKGDTLFVFARASSGPKMPLAILRVPVPSQWPFRFELSDAMAMAPGMNLSSFAEVVIEARISKAGTATLQPGDLQGVTPSIRPPTSALKVLIDKVAP
ncbi:MAG: c-type cytochrome biogenesis protein CcmI [Rhodocyclaceae bacterium]|nr:c-type cytochrome biogenesis protein CcmI [Rhodocyclaceae bacterium]MCA3026253.1 c-type cytochrome biogenesis protein CcmI [Rhodocyclaceae bacterium]MCA3032087.1 c-type cytochrome biogenesis protein CcmI [Rhodocyclaceae bacterium]MCA3038188.1 c-type cytochrome biogenesis protein CcmI [Rhodocyclaceae bacterium]MCA3039038.1 c-type cytochrome biogenesis protein CcmI [Rhodocyclaceae bacterium]